MKKKAPIQFLFLGGEAVTFAFSGAVMFVLISRVSGPELLGVYSLAFAWMTVFQALANFGLPGFLLREFGRCKEEEHGKYFSNVMIMGLATAISAVLIMSGAVRLVGYDPEVRSALTFAAVVLLPVFVTLTCRAGFLANKRSELILGLAIMETALILCGNVYLVLHGYGIVPLIQTVVFAKSMTCLVSLFLFRKYITSWRWELDISFCRKLLPAVAAFAAGSVLGLLSMRINVIMLSWWGNLSIVGLYAAAAKFVEFLHMLPDIFVQFMLPQVSRTLAKNPPGRLKDHAKAFYFQFALTTTLGLGLIYFADPVINLLFGPSFQGTVMVLQILMVFFLVQCLSNSLAMVMLAAGKQKRDVAMHSCDLVLNVLLNVILIPFFGGAGAASARLVGVLVCCTLRYVYIAKHVDRYAWFSLMIKPFVICSLLLGCVFMLREHAHFIVLGLLYVGSSAGLLYVANNLVVRSRHP